MLLLGEPPATQADLHFRLFGVPVRVHPFFWLATLILGLGPEDVKPVRVLVWVIVVFISILVHELGHAFMQRYFGGRPWITLYSFGGLASCSDCDRSPRAQLLISFAGPLAGFVLVGILIAAIAASGNVIGFAISRERIHVDVLVLVQSMAGFVAYFEPFRSKVVNDTIGSLLHVNIMWGLINLLPIYPLDGGQISRELFTLRNPRGGIVQSLQLSVGTAAIVAVYAVLNGSLYMCFMFGLLGVGSYQTLQRYQDRWR
jgi:stage IV sporulation protein FB